MQAANIKLHFEHCLGKQAWIEALDILASVPEELKEAWMDIEMRDLRIEPFRDG